MFFTEKKANSRVNELSEYRYRNKVSLSEWTFVEDDGEIGAYPSEKHTNESKKDVIGDHWSGRDLYAWLSKDITLPSDWSDKIIVCIFDFGNTGDGNNSGFESFLLVDEQPYQGVDSNHKEVFFPVEKAGKKVALDFRLRSEEHTSELQSRFDLVCRLLLEKKK